MITLFGQWLGIPPEIFQPAMRKTNLENLLSKGLRSGVVKMVSDIQLYLKNSTNHTIRPMTKSYNKSIFFQFLLTMVGTWIMGACVAQVVVPFPEQIDKAMTEKLWVFIKQETNAPDNLALPPIFFDEKIPKEARMMFQFPSVDAPDNELQISIGVKSTRLWRQEMLLWALGHELTHYAFLMQENEWQQKALYENNIRHHCNFEFMRITRDIVEIIWDQYQSVASKMRMYDEVIKSCSRQPLQ